MEKNEKLSLLMDWEPHPQTPWYQNPLAFGPDHPTKIQESYALKMTISPDPSPFASDWLLDTCRQGRVSVMQMETAASIARAFKSHRAFFIGDATGVGKTRSVLAGVENFRRISHEETCAVLWVSTKISLQDALWTECRSLFGNNTRPKEWKFTTYSKLRSYSDEYFDIQSWMNEMFKQKITIVLVMDEAHACKNNSNTKYALDALQHKIMESCSKSCICYCTATPASDIDKIGYMGALRMWGPRSKTIFSSFSEFKTELRGRGTACMEMIAVALKKKVSTLQEA